MEFAIDDITALGKERNYGNLVTRYVARLHTGRKVMIDSKGRSKQEQRWLSRVGRYIPLGGRTSRDCPQSIIWFDLVTAGGAP